MKQVLITTTINVPTVLRQYRKIGPSIPFIVIGDQKSPHEEIQALMEELGTAVYMTPEQQEEAYPALSDAIGWNNVQRRNIGILEAAKLEPDIIVSVDDDNIPTQPTYFSDIANAFRNPHYGQLARGEWFNIGTLAEEWFTYRGFPFRQIQPYADYAMNGKAHEIGIVNGLIFGDPDVTARERIDKDPRVRTYTPTAQAGIAVNPSETWTPINAQNTAYRADLAPLMLQLPDVGRYDDIWGSYIAQAVLMNTDLHVRFGTPFVKQLRNPHDLEKDLADEEYGSVWSHHLSQFLRGLEVPAGTVLERLRYVTERVKAAEVELPFEFFDRWIEAWE